jgi:hypothetical protein
LGVGHEDLLWRIRLEPELINVFAKIWGTDELLVSFGKRIAPKFLVKTRLSRFVLRLQTELTSLFRFHLPRFKTEVVLGLTMIKRLLREVWNAFRGLRIL